MNKYFLCTNDTESTSLVNHALTLQAGKLVLEQGIPRLLDLYAKYNVKSTFFFTGEIVEKYPSVVKAIIPYGHEVACHGYSHEVNEAFDILSYKQQIEHLTKTKKMLEDISGQEVISFRAPALRVNKDTPMALKSTGFKIDSSIASQRFDFFLSFGSLKKINRFFSPRQPYYTNPTDLSKSGSGEILEIPISALLFPYIGTTLRIFPNVTTFFRNLLFVEAIITGKPINFLTHPNEFIDEEKTMHQIKGRTNNVFASLFADRIRYYLKLKNLGQLALPLLEKELIFFTKRDFKFITLQEYKRIHDLSNDQI